MSRNQYNERYNYPADTNTAHKGRSPMFFQNTRITSCNYVSMKNGKPVAIPFKPNVPTYGSDYKAAKYRDQIQIPIKLMRDIEDCNPKKTAYADQYRLRHHSSAGSFRKPLARYSTNLSRSR